MLLVMTFQTSGCIYGNGFGPFNADFSAANCSEYGGSPCEEPVVGTPGCMDANASNFNAEADVAGLDQYGNSLCVYASCDDIPTWGCIYGNGFGAFNADFSAAQCSEYGGSPCEEPACAPLDFTAANTGSNMTLFITPAAVSADLAEGDMIGVFFTNDAGDLVCAGSSAWTGSSMQVTAYGDDATTDVVDGFSAGEVVVWKAQNSSGVYDVVPTYANGNGSFAPDALLLISSLDFTYSCSGTVPTGCTDATATNYDSNASEDDGSCIATVVGCMDGHYLEFNAEANVSNQSLCVTWKAEGCTDSTATNYDMVANLDDGSCIATVLGCTDASADNYNSLANTEDNSCTYVVIGCMDTLASNFAADATEAGFDQWGNSTCVYASCEDIPTWGCIYADGFGSFNADFSAAQCSEYGGSPCEEPSSDVAGCMDTLAI